MSACGEGQIDHAGCFCTQTWERTKVLNFWFSHTKTWDVYLLTCNRVQTAELPLIHLLLRPTPLTQTSCFARCEAAIDYVLWCFYDICLLNLVTFDEFLICIDVQNKQQAAADHYRCLTFCSATRISLFVCNSLEKQKALSAVKMPVLMRRNCKMQKKKCNTL